jgi:hypothetical protein
LVSENNNHYIGDQDKRRPLTTVGHLAAAFFSNTSPKEFGHYSIHLSDETAIPVILKDPSLLDNRKVL